MPTPLLDHIVILLPHALLTNPPPSLTRHFTISPGGRHGDNKTENKLVLFKDGTYLELISFINDDPAHREGHWWGDKGYGVIDYAYTLKEGAAGFKAIDAKLQGLDIPAGWKPGPLKGGSRLNGDGERIEWQVSFPAPAERGRAPFWCFDVTPRERRVKTDEALVTHPCGAKGVGSLHVFGTEEHVGWMRLLQDAMCERGGEGDEWDLGTPRRISSFVPCQITAEVKGGREKGLNARVMVLTQGEAGERRGVLEDVEGDELAIGFVEA